MTQYSPSSAKTYSFCSKKYYFTWLSHKKQGWRKDHTHPWYTVYSLKRVKQSNTWAGDVYHKVIAHTLQQISKRKPVKLSSVLRFASDLIAEQFTYSQNKNFVGVAESKAPTLDGISLFLALFEHVYNLSDAEILKTAQQNIDLWLTNTFSWDRWDEVCDLVRQASFTYVEPENFWYSLGGAKISARMDFGIELRNGKFIIFDWKCYNENADFTEYNEKLFKHQLLTYALWPTLRERNPLSIHNVSAHVYYPTQNRTLDFTFTEEDIWDYELLIQQWTSFHDQVFTEISEVEFEDLSGPSNPERSCPWCQFKAICGEEIEWHKLT
jgi:hypothetical protein